MNRIQRVNLSVEQKLEYAKLMVNEGYTNQQVREYQVPAQQPYPVGKDNAWLK